MADISKINLPNDTNNPYDIADTTARSGLSDKMDKVNPEGTGSLSLGRKSGTTTGDMSVAMGYNCTASGRRATAIGDATTASGDYSCAINSDSIASGSRSFAQGQGTTASGFAAVSEGHSTTASGSYSYAQGYQTISNHKSQHVYGEYNVADTSPLESDTKGTYIEIVGNGTGNNARSNARTLDWSGNEVLAGDCTIMGDKSLNNAITPYYYNANTDRNTQENRETAIKYVLTNYFSKGGTSATIRYSGGYYNSYIYCGGSGSNLQIIEFCQLQSSGEKVIYWMYATSNNELNKIFALS